MYLSHVLPFDVVKACSIGILTRIRLSEEGRGLFCSGRGRRDLAQGTGSSVVGVFSCAIVMLTIALAARHVNSG